MTNAQKETLRFYTTNDYLLINGMLWGEDEKTIDKYINIINEDGRGVMAEASQQGYAVRWNCSEEEGERLYEVYQRRFPIIDSVAVKEKILKQARVDIDNMMSCMAPVQSEMVLYRNIRTMFLDKLEEGMPLDYLGFSSCSLNPHVAENGEYGSIECTLAEITVPAGTLAIRLDLMPDVQNEPDEIILAPVKFVISKIDKNSNKIYLTCLKSSN